MPLPIPTLDDRRYQDLLDEALARIPVHNPEWTNFNKSDPGVTLIEVFAFLTENLLYRCNQVPERNRRKFLSLLGVPLQPAWYARGLVSFSNDRGPLQTITLNRALEVRAGEIPFRTEQGLHILPMEARCYFKRTLTNQPEELKAYYRQLYASYKGQPPTADIQLYETVPFPIRGGGEVDLGRETVDRSLWIALMLRAGDTPYAEKMDQARAALAGKTVSFGIVPSLSDATRRLIPGRQTRPEDVTLLQYEIPIGGSLPATEADRVPQYRVLEARAEVNVLETPGIVQIKLPSSSSELRLWDNLDPLEPGVGDFPPALEDTKLNDRVITWLRVRAVAAAQAKLRWAGLNTVFVTQRARVANEVLPTGTGAPDQVVKLAKTPVVSGSLRLTVTPRTGAAEVWEEIDDLTSAGSEVPVPDPRFPAGASGPKSPRVKVFALDPESGQIRFGDGFRGARPPFGSTLRVDYDYGVGRAGNVGEGSINSSPALPAGIKVNNPVPTWGGAEAETVAEGEKQISRFLQHRDRLVSASDFDSIVRRTPGVDVGRVEVIPAFNPELSPNEPGDAPGAVSVMVIPKYDPVQPDAPVPDRLFLNTICEYIDPRRLVTTEVFLRGPVYKPIWVSVGIDVLSGMTMAEVGDAVKRALSQFLSPLPPANSKPVDELTALLETPQYAESRRGWPLRKPVVDRELLAVASRVKGVLLVNDVLVAEGNKTADRQIKMNGLELPRVLGISVSLGAPQDLDQLRGQATPAPGTTPVSLVPVPLIPEEC